MQTQGVMLEQPEIVSCLFVSSVHEPERESALNVWEHPGTENLRMKPMQIKIKEEKEVLMTTLEPLKLLPSLAFSVE